MGKKIINIDQLIDSAMAKDRMKIEEMPKQGNPSLFYKNATVSKMGPLRPLRLLQKRTLMFMIGIFSAIGIGAASYFIFSSEERPMLHQENKVVSTPVDTIRKEQNEPAEDVSKKVIPAPHAKKIIKSTKVRQHWE